MKTYIETLEKRVEAMKAKADKLWETNPDGANYFESVILAPEEEALKNALIAAAERVSVTPEDSELIKSIQESKGVRAVFWGCNNLSHKGVTWDHSSKPSIAKCDVCGSTNHKTLT